MNTSSNCMSVLPSELISELGTIKTKQSKKQHNKPKKQNKKFISACIQDEVYARDEYTKYYGNESMINNFHHLSAKERSSFDHKFTEPKNKSQEIYSSILRNKSKKIVVAVGPAGTGKTLFATEYGIRYFLSESYEKLIFTRPSVTVDEDIGYLPGTLEDKMAPWVRPIYDILYNFFTVKEVETLMTEKIIEIAPLGFMRGRTFKNAWIVADEMQNSTISQMKMLLTRLGENSRLIITGDLDQYDKPEYVNGLEDFLNRFKFKHSNSITSFEFEKDDIQREEVVKEVLEIYSKESSPEYTSDSSSETSRTI